MKVIKAVFLFVGPFMFGTFVSWFVEGFFGTSLDGVDKVTLGAYRAIHMVLGVGLACFIMNGINRARQ